MKENELKTLLVRLNPELHKQMRHISIDTGISLNEYVVQAFCVHLKMECLTTQQILE